MTYDIIIIGGGAAGLAAAVFASENKNAKILLLERLDRVGKKLALTGNGRCNITNRRICKNNYHGTDVDFGFDILKKFTVSDTESFFEQLGVPVIYEGDKGYPSSLQAASVTDALRFRADEHGVETMCSQRVTDIKKRGDFFEVFTDDGKFIAKSIIVATGMLSGGEKLGCDGAVMGILKRMGLKTASPKPAIVQLKTETEFVRQLKGIKIDATVSLIRKNRILRTGFGEVLFCNYGLSGPPVLQLSGDACERDVISLDLMPSLDHKTLEAKLFERKSMLSMRLNDEFLSGMLNKRLGQVVLKRAGLKLSDAVSTIRSDDIKNICAVIKSFDSIVLGNTGFLHSQVTKGGILTSALHKDTLMCRSLPGLFVAGEIIDIDGDCGGFNLQWAWASGYTAARGALDYIGADK